jgi:hypothetical protein
MFILFETWGVHAQKKKKETERDDDHSPFFEVSSRLTSHHFLISGQFNPNGTMNNGEAHFWSMDLSSLRIPSQQGLVVWLNTLEGKIGWYLSKNGELPSDDNHYDGTVTECENHQRCNYVLTGIGACEPSETLWYLGTYNMADSGNSSYSMIVEIQGERMREREKERKKKEKRQYMLKL